VCGDDGNTYWNDCLAECSDVSSNAGLCDDSLFVAQYCARFSESYCDSIELCKPGNVNYVPDTLAAITGMIFESSKFKPNFDISLKKEILSPCSNF
tara:strand:+ start:1016 stop:1303 length:288 start_codon:yes stop_codon:yes gene_type:complete